MSSTDRRATPADRAELLNTSNDRPIAELSADELRQRVTRLEQSLSALKERLAMEERIFQHNPIPMLVYSALDLTILKANESALALYGRNLQELQGLSILELCTEPVPGLGIEIAEELRKPFGSISRVNHKTADGRLLVLRLASWPFEADGVSARIMLIEDQTGSHNTEEALRASEERFRELFENANDVIFLHDLKGDVLEINRAAEHLTGYSRTEVLGKNFADLVVPEARSMILDIVRAHLGGSAPQHYELPVISKHGNLRFLEVSTRMIYRRGHPVAIQGIGRDITERKHAQQRLLESSRELQLKNEELSTALRLAREATQLKEQFLANTSHELRTPMNGIMGMINLLKTTELTIDQREYADAVSQCANDLLTIINDLLDLSQMEARQLSLDEGPFDVQESLRNVVMLLRVRAVAKDLALTYEIDPGFPQYIYGDSVRFRQILTNLIANAVKFTLRGKVTVRLGRKEPGTMLRCEVIDSGIGVAEGVRDRIFEAFFQADGTTRRRFGGTGLGLAICKQLVELMGGSIGMFNNQPPPGATFWFEIPLREADRASVTNSPDYEWVESSETAP